MRACIHCGNTTGFTLIGGPCISCEYDEPECECPAADEVVLTAPEADAVREWLKIRRQCVVEEMHGDIDAAHEEQCYLAEERVAYLLSRLIVETRWS